MVFVVAKHGKNTGTFICQYALFFNISLCPVRNRHFIANGIKRLKLFIDDTGTLKKQPPFKIVLDMILHSCVLTVVRAQGHGKVSFISYVRVIFDIIQ